MAGSNSFSLLLPNKRVHPCSRISRDELKVRASCWELNWFVLPFVNKWVVIDDKYVNFSYTCALLLYIDVQLFTSQVSKARKRDAEAYENSKAFFNAKHMDSFLWMIMHTGELGFYRLDCLQKRCRESEANIIITPNRREHTVRFARRGLLTVPVAGRWAVECWQVPSGERGEQTTVSEKFLDFSRDATDRNCTHVNVSHEFGRENHLPAVMETCLAGPDPHPKTPLEFWDSVHVCEPHTHTIRGSIRRWHVNLNSYNHL